MADTIALVYEGSTILSSAIALMTKLTHKHKYSNINTLLEYLSTVKVDAIILTSSMLSRADMLKLIPVVKSIRVMSRFKNDINAYLSADEDSRLNGELLPKVTSFDHDNLFHVIPITTLNKIMQWRFSIIMSVDSPEYASSVLARIETEEMKKTFSNTCDFVFQALLADSLTPKAEDIVKSFFSMTEAEFATMIDTGRRIANAKDNYRKELAMSLVKHGYNAIKIKGKNESYNGLCCFTSPVFEQEVMALLTLQLRGGMQLEGKKIDFAMSCMFAQYKEERGVLFTVITANPDIAEAATEGAVFINKTKPENIHSTNWLSLEEFWKKY